MNGIAIERVLSLIDDNIDLTKAEVLKYIEEHQHDVIQQLRTTGEARIPTTGGVVIIPMSVLEASAA